MTWSAGMSLPPLRIERVAPQNMQFWAQLLRDPNPIHLDRNAVQALGLGSRLINQGPSNLAFLIAMVQRAIPGARIRSFDVRYLDNLFEDDIAVASGVVTDVTPGTPTLLKCEATLTAEGRADGKGTVIQANALLEL